MSPASSALPPPHATPLWYKDAVIYQLHIRSFYDANNDGIGDFPGLTEKLDYIASLGVDTIWLLPFYPSPRRDDGYDIADYRGVHPDYGTIADARRFIRAAHARGLRVITELVVNHTSDQHPWFQRARRARPGSAARNYYVWSDDDQAYAGTRIIFCDTEKSNWTRDPVAGAYFWHRFYSHQPDLNYDNPQVLKEILSVMRYWLDMGVDGMRLDAVPYLVEREGTNNENLPETHQILRRIRAVIDAEYPGRMLLAEANQWPEDAQEYFGNGDECHMSFHFPLMPRMYMAIAQEDRFPITDIIKQTPEIPPTCQWAIFLRNHDELTLEMVTSEERDYLWNVYAADPRARINLGIRRRLAPLLERDRRRIELMNSLLLSMPGTPVLYYGDELGMGDNIHLGDRDGVRTPMQWSPDRNGGFSRADPERLPLPVLMGPLYGYEAVNVEAQQRDPHSLLNWTRRMVAIRRQSKIFGRGTLRFLYPGNRKILAYLRQDGETTVLCVANLSNTAQPVELDLAEFDGKVPVEMLGESPFPDIGKLPYLLTLPPYAFYWFELSSDRPSPAWHTQAPARMPELTTLVLRGRSGFALTESSRRALEHDVLPTFLQRQRWFPAERRIEEARLVDSTPLAGGGTEEYLVTEIETGTGAARQRLHVPLAVAWKPASQQHYVLARTRRGADVGVLTDASLQEGFVRTLVAALRAGREQPAGGESQSTLCFLAEPGLRDLDLPADAPLHWHGGEQTNSSVTIGEAAILKILRRVEAGVFPEVEMSRRLTQAGYANTPALLGEVARRDADGSTRTLALLHAYLIHEGDAWVWTIDYLKRALDDALLRDASVEEFNEGLAGYATVACTVGRRLAELHSVLARPCDDPAFAPEVAQSEDAQARAEQIVAMLDRALHTLRGLRDTLEPGARACAAWLDEHRDRLVERIAVLAQAETGTPHLRIHGDFHLGQVLLAQTDAYLIDFEGEPGRPLSARRAKTSPLKDVAGMLRSFDYAAATVSRGDPLGSPPSAGAAGAGAAADAQQDRRGMLLEQFRARAEQAFMQGYHSGADDALKLPPQREQALIQAALIEKAAYEIGYEARHRPDWVSIPLCGLAELARSLLISAAIDHEEHRP
ncbi:maltose alpha-D-glucosyltransferase [Bordetella genomosp. 2]|uniref:Maltokinase n=1 Tax=Bordetella genomosp. 2 TaxID=1983456 RepID=A0A261VRK6_9BORD|nr:maltose alpha-D-glucosyltransferase [Bordetella genomosp. 2]OZI76744.1 maltose alpha-D-glucosyltransferase [Bordetella genomosp. 2]